MACGGACGALRISETIPTTVALTGGDPSSMIRSRAPTAAPSGQWRSASAWLITGKRAGARGPAGSGDEPLVLYWYEWKRRAAGDVEWIRRVIHEGGDVGGGLQIRAADLDADGDQDLVVSGKSGLFVLENSGRP